MPVSLGEKVKEMLSTVNVGGLGTRERRLRNTLAATQRTFPRVILGGVSVLMLVTALRSEATV
jgi:hypothetical protein